MKDGTGGIKVQNIDLILLHSLQPSGFIKCWEVLE
jgi:hypothetical protein